MICTVAAILENKKISENIYKISIEGKFEGKPGQFYMLKTTNSEFLLPRPISIYDVKEDRVEFLYQVAGEGTKIISKLNEGDYMQVMGPLGNGFEVDKIKGKIAIVTGGIGVAPVGMLIRNLKECKIDLYSGFRDIDYAVEDLKEYVSKIEISTETGEVGHKGYVTDLLKPQNYDLIITCGPEIMMKKIVEMCKKENVKCLVSMENRMACGIGACLGCTCKTDKGNLRTCKEGPVFWGEELMLDE